MISDENQVEIMFDAKYDDRINVNDYNFLYHLTSNDKIEKIKKNGLVPYTRSKVSMHPERIYFSTSLKFQDIIFNKFKLFQPNKSLFTIIISTVLIPDKIQFYKDPNFKDNGIYTYVNIPPSTIVEITKIDE